MLTVRRASLFALLPSLAACAPAEPPAYQHPFENAERWSKEFDDPSRDSWQQPDQVITAMHIQGGMTVADVGAGTGYFEPYLSRAVGDAGHVLALDLEPDMVRHLTERAEREKLGNVVARQVAADDPGLEAKSVDRILIVNTWHHISNRSLYAARIKAALRPFGQVVVVDFRREAHRGPPPEHRIAPDEVARELEGGGLDARVVDAGLPEQYVVIGTTS